VITPTIGRKVWYFDAAGQPEQDATVIDVHGDRCVSLFVVNRGGTTSVRRSVTLVQKGDDAMPSGSHCTWMPYQNAQAAKAAPAAQPAYALPHQQRVYDEKVARDAELGRLRAFLGTELFQQLPGQEKTRMLRQANLMADLSAVLGERIAAFPA
jgi:hypothetical protein